MNSWEYTSPVDAGRGTGTFQHQRVHSRKARPPPGAWRIGRVETAHETNSPRTSSRAWPRGVSSSRPYISVHLQGGCPALVTSLRFVSPPHTTQRGRLVVGILIMPPPIHPDLPVPHRRKPGFWTHFYGISPRPSTGSTGGRRKGARRPGLPPLLRLTPATITTAHQRPVEGVNGTL